MLTTTSFFWKDRLRASAIHLGISLCVAALAALLVFLVWYPYPYRIISGGRELFTILVSVDVVIGPLITLAVFNRNKPRSELRRDLAVVGALQLVALGYGMWTMYAARPVHLVFEYDRFRVVHAIDVPPELMNRAPENIDAMPLTGPTLLALRPFRDEREKSEATLAALQGLMLGARPDLWQSYADARQRVLQAAKPVAALKQRYASKTAEIDAAIARTGRPAATLLYLPIVGRQSSWTVLLDPSTAEVLAFLPLDSF
jgi:hypothetical protein